MKSAIVNVDVFRSVLRFHFDSIGMAIRERQIRDGHAIAWADVHNVIVADFAVPPLSAECDLGWISSRASYGDILHLAENHDPRHFVLAVGEEDSAARF